MKKIKQSFIEIVTGEPKREHYINVSIVVTLVALVVWVVLAFTKIGKVN